MSSQRLKVLVSVYTCEPGRGSEGGIGWHWVNQIARFHDVWALAWGGSKTFVEPILKETGTPNIHWTFYDLPFWKWREGQAGERIHYNLWQAGAFFKAKALHKQVKFDVTHHLTLGQYWSVSYLPYLSAPFIWGPVGGAETVPPVFYQTFSAEGRRHEYMRDLARGLGEQYHRLHRTVRNTAMALVKTPDTEQRVRALGAQQIQQFTDFGLEVVQLQSLCAMPIRTESPFRLISIGRLLHWKGFHLGLQAFAQFNRTHPTSEYWIIGDGPERASLQQMAQDLGIAQQVKFLGWLSRAEVLQTLTNCDVLVHPSLHEAGGGVCLEAIAAGRPVICLNIGGPAVLISDGVGIKVSTVTPLQTIQELAMAMEKLETSPTLRQQFGQAGRILAQQYAWDNQGEAMRKVYDNVLNESPRTK